MPLPVNIEFKMSNLFRIQLDSIKLQFTQLTNHLSHDKCFSEALSMLSGSNINQRFLNIGCPDFNSEIESMLERETSKLYQYQLDNCKVKLCYSYGKFILYRNSCSESENINDTFFVWVVDSF